MRFKLLGTYAWPGNVRELLNKILKAYMHSDKMIDCAQFSNLNTDDDLESEINKIRRVEDFPTYNEFIETFRKRVERLYIEKAMILADGKRTKAALLTGLPYTTYIHKRKTLGLTLGHNK